MNPIPKGVSIPNTLSSHFMMMCPSSRPRRSHLIGALLSGVLATTIANAADYRTEYDKRIKSTQNIGILGKDVAGDRLDFYKGTTTFQAQDLAIPGNSALAVALGRTYVVEPEHMAADSLGTQSNPVIYSTRQYAFGDWDLDTPYLTGRFHQSVGWQVDSTTPLNRCSVVGQTKSSGAPADGIPLAPSNNPPTGLMGGSPWNGYTLHVDGADQSLLLASLPNPNRPVGGSYHWLTEKHWWFSCLPATAQSGNGEGFLAIAPDGTKYWFDKLSQRKASHLELEFVIDEGAAVAPSRLGNVVARKTEAMGIVPGKRSKAFDSGGMFAAGGSHVKTGYTYASDVFLLATRVEDRFGNWVAYSYSNDAFARLQSITSSDGRQINLTYNAQGFVQSASDGTRTVLYEYNGNSLSRVVLPDASAWTYGFSALSNGAISQIFYPATATAYVLTPQGARVDFEFGYHFQASPEPCSTTAANADAACSTTPGLQSKTVSGPGIASQTWRYGYGMSYTAFMAACGAGMQTCPTRTWTDEIGPDYSITRRMFGIVRGVDETLLMQELQGVVPTTTNQGTQPPAANRINASIRSGEPDLVDDPLASNVPTTTVTGAPQFFRETDFYYPTIATAPRLGVNPLGSNLLMASDSFPQVLASERHLGPLRRSTYQDKRVFTWEVATCTGGAACVDAYGRPTKVIKSSAPSP